MKLKPCPFCGNEAIKKHNYNPAYDGAIPIMIECLHCGASTSFQIGEDAWKENKVSAAWNRRAHD